jgi:hypothetical protein
MKKEKNYQNEKLISLRVLQKDLVVLSMVVQILHKWSKLLHSIEETTKKEERKKQSFP